MNNTLELTIDLPFMKAGTRYQFHEKSGDIFRVGDPEVLHISLAAYLWLLRKERVFSDAELLANNKNPADNPYKYFKLCEEFDGEVSQL